MIDRRPQAAMIIVFQCDKAKGLEHALRRPARRLQNFSHAVHRTGLRLKSKFDKCAIAKGTFQLQQAAGDRNRLKFCFGAPAIF